LSELDESNFTELQVEQYYEEAIEFVYELHLETIQLEIEKEEQIRQKQVIDISIMDNEDDNEDSMGNDIDEHTMSLYKRLKKKQMEILKKLIPKKIMQMN
jgi:hypothetical protein